MATPPSSLELRNIFIDHAGGPEQTRLRTAQEHLNALTSEQLWQIHEQRRQIREQQHDLLDEVIQADIQAMRQRTENATVDTTDFALRIRANVLRNIEEQPDMAPIATATATAAAATTATLDPRIPENLESPLSPFSLQLNTQDIELRALRDSQPQGVLARDYQTPIAQGMQSERRRVRAYLTAAKKAKRVAMTVRLLVENNKAHYTDIFHDMYTHGQLQDMRRRDFDFRDMGLMQECTTAVLHYFRRKKEYLENKAYFAPRQALYNQQVARIRQKPRATTTLDPQRIIDVVSQWENVWGVKIRRTDTFGDDTLSIRIGLCDICMEESAPSTQYDYEANILLAPFYFTIDLSNNGNFVCRSQNGNTRGLSRENNQGGLSYDVHPHQLSDAPCFGTFGQTFVDMARTGDMISLIGGIIAFYSQYNSNDSAGVAARLHHPANLPPPNQDYIRRLLPYFNEERQGSLNEGKLRQAFDQYMQYHEVTSRENPPVVTVSQVCYNCEEEPVHDEHVYWITNNGDRVCSACWESSYCSECERHVDDCECHDES